MNKNLKILLVEDNADDARLIAEMLKDAGTGAFELERVDRLASGLTRLSEATYDALLLDLELPDSEGIGTLEKVLEQSPDLPVAVLTGDINETTGIRAVNAGAQDYLVKGSVSSDLLSRSIRYSIERKRLMVELRNQSLRDDLTGLNNRRGFFTMAEQQIKLARREKKALFFVVADLDDMKQINDSMGHQIGDLALRDVADILRKTFRESDIIGRIGGDEFAVSMVEEDPSGKDIVMSRLKEKLKEHNELEDRPFSLSLSLGIARCDPEAVCSIDEMLSRADKLMYEQKRARKTSSRVEQNPR